MVCIDAEKTSGHYVREPFDKEPDFKAASVNYDLEKLLTTALEPA